MLEIVKYPDERLRMKAEDCKDFTVLESLVKEMFETMFKSGGIGLAAPQVGYNLNLFIINHGEGLTFINAKILPSRNARIIQSDEGCLSLPGVRVTVPRFDKFTFEAVDLTGKIKKYQYCGMMGIIAQHETDHLIGKLIIDYQDEKTRLEKT